MDAQEQEEEMKLERKASMIKKQYGKDLCKEHYGIAIIKGDPCEYARDNRCEGYSGNCNRYEGHKVVVKP